MQGSLEAGAPARAGASRARAAGRAVCASTLLALVAAASAASAADLVAVRVGRHDGFTRVVLETDAAVTHRVDAPASGDRVVVELDARSASRSIASRSRHLSAVRVEPAAGGTRVRVDLRRAVDVRSFVLRGPDRVVLDLYDVGEAPGEATTVGRAAPPAPAPTPAPAPEPAPRAEGGRTPTPTPEDEGLVDLPSPAVAEDEPDPDLPPTWEQLAAQDRPPGGEAPAPGAEPEPAGSATPEGAPGGAGAPGEAALPRFEEGSEAEAAASAEAARELGEPAPPDEELAMPEEPGAGMEAEPPSELERAFPEPPVVPPPGEEAEGGGPGLPLLLLLLAIGFLAFLMVRSRRRSELKSQERLASAYANARSDLEVDAQPDTGGSEPALAVPASEAAPDDLPERRGDFAAAGSLAAEPSLFDLPAAEFAREPSRPTHDPGAAMEPYAPTHTSRTPAAGGDSDRLLAELERRIAHLETRVEELADARERLERQVAAQTEELRVQRAAIARTQRVLRGMARPEDEASEPVPKT